METKTTVHHTKEQLTAFAAALRYQRLCRAFLASLEDKEYLRKDAIERLWHLFCMVEAELDLIRLQRNQKNSNTPPEMAANAQNPNICDFYKVDPTEIRLVIDSLSEHLGRHVLISGPTGSGKSTLGAYILDQVMRLRGKCKFDDYLTAVNRLCNLQQKQDLEGYDRLIDELSAYDCLLLDDCFMDQCRDNETAVLRDLINRMNERRHSLILVSQVATGLWYKHFTNAYGGEAVLDRVLKAGPFIIKLKGKSLRAAPPTKIESHREEDDKTPNSAEEK